MPELTTYTGNAGLGVGSNSGPAPLGPNDNLKTIDSVGRDIMLLDAERNTKLFQQKVADRDMLTQAILNNQVHAGEIDPKYHAAFDEAQADVEKSYDQWGGNYNDMDGYRKYQASVTHLQDVATHAQVNTVEMKKLIQQRSTETLPWKQKQLDQWIGKQQGKDFWDHVDPYQQAFSFSIDPIKKLYATSSTSITSPDRLWKYDITHADFGATMKNAQNEYLNQGETAEDMREFLGQVDNYDPMQKKKFVDAINGQLQKYNGDLGLQQGQGGYAEPIQLVDGPDGKQHIVASPSDFAAKYALSQQEKFMVQGPGQFQKDVGTFGLGKEKNAIAWAKLNKVDIPKAWAYVDKWKNQKKQLTEQEQVGAQKYNDLVDQIDVNAPMMGDSRVPPLNRINTDQLPASRQFIGGIVYGPGGKEMLGRLYPKVNLYDEKKRSFVKGKSMAYSDYEKEIKAKLTNLPYPDWVKAKAEDQDLKVESFYDVNYYSPTGKKLGSESDLPDELKEGYRNFSKNYGGTFSQYLKGLSKTGKIVVQFEGQNGTATPQSILEGSRLEQEKSGKRGFEGIYGGGEEGEGTTPEDQ